MTHLTAAEQEGRMRASDLIRSCDGLAHTAPGLAAASRMAARCLLETLDTLDAERSARIAIQEARDRCLAILERQAGEAATRAVTTT